MSPAKIICLMIAALFIFYPSILEIVKDARESFLNKTKGLGKERRRAINRQKWIDAFEDIGHVVLGVYWIYVLLSNEAAKVHEEVLEAFPEHLGGIFFSNVAMTAVILGGDTLIKMPFVIVAQLLYPGDIRDPRMMKEKGVEVLHVLLEEIGEIASGVVIVGIVSLIAPDLKEVWPLLCLLIVEVLAGVYSFLRTQFRKLRAIKKEHPILEGRRIAIDRKGKRDISHVYLLEEGDSVSLFTMKDGSVSAFVGKRLYEALSEDELVDLLKVELSRKSHNPSLSIYLSEVLGWTGIFLLFLFFRFLPGFNAFFSSGDDDFAFCFCLVINFGHAFINASIGFLLSHLLRRRHIAFVKKELPIEKKRYIEILEKIELSKKDGFVRCTLRKAMSEKVPGLDVLRSAISKGE